MRCNHTKEHPDFHAHVIDSAGGGAVGSESRAGPHRVRWRTPLGHTYQSTAPPLLYSATPRYPGETYEPHPDSIIEITFTHALAS